MSVFDSSIKQINKILGITAAGQAAKAASIPVALASDTEFVRVSDAEYNSAHSGIPALAVRKNTAAALSADAGYTPLISDGYGRLHVYPSGLGGTGNGFSSSVGERAASATVEILATTYPTLIEALEFATENADWVRIALSHYTGSAYTEITLLNSSGSAISGFYPAAVNEMGSSLFDIEQYDTTNNKYKIVLRRPLSFALGVKVEIMNAHATTAYDAGCHIVFRRMP